MAKNEGGLEFRDVENFNQAMLSKNFWRLLINLDSLTARILKEKYYKDGDILNAKLGVCSSHIWRSIWGSRYLIQELMRWRVRNGVKIKI